MTEPQLQPQLPLDTDQVSYFKKRMADLGIKDEYNVIQIKQTEIDQSSPLLGETVLKPFPIFTEVAKGIDILVYTLNRTRIRYAKENQRHLNHIYTVTRLYPEVTKKDGSIQKYSMPKGQPTLPFFPPGLVTKFEEKQKIPVLYITEGYFKAFKAYMHGIDCVGLPSITCMRDSETGELHGDIQKLIAKCDVERVVWLTDGDCRNITTKEIKDGDDLYKRPKGFFTTVSTFFELMSKFDNVQKYFAHINTENLHITEKERIIEEGPKGLDDLLCRYPDNTAEIAEEFRDFSKISGKGVFEGRYLVRVNISHNIMRINHYFFLNDVDKFYLYHSEKRKDLKEAKNFKYHGTLYHYDEAEGKCVVEIPSSAADYFRSDDDYYQFIDVPNRYGNIVRQFHRRSKSTIKDDNPSTDFFKHVPKYQTFCVVPDHLNYQRVINNCFNMYAPFLHEPEDGDFEITLDFVKHIFGEDDVPYTNDDGTTGTVKRWELGLDYLTLLYKKPQQILPILCLVSSERQTGKTLFAKWLNQIYTENMAIVGNEDLQNPFNSHWAGKLIICCDETKIDKQVVVEKVKSLSTSTQVMMNAKGRDQINMEFFGKFIFLTNNEDNFINIDAQEIRFWIISVPTVKKRNVNLLEDMLTEIPAFLHFLNTRQMVTSYKERHWFDTQLLQTEALNKIKANSKPSLEKRIATEVGELFEMSQQETITIPMVGLVELMKNVDKNYLQRCLKNMGYLTQRPARLKYPKMKVGTLDGGLGEKAEYGHTVEFIAFNTTYYEFKREDFTDVPLNSDAAQPTNKEDMPF